jgi:ElaA protein
MNKSKPVNTQLPKTLLTNPEIKVAKLDDLKPKQIVNIFEIRFNVFVLEQQSIYNEFDGHDFDATHLFIEDEEKLVGYARIYTHDLNSATFGRVAIAKGYRKQKLGKRLIEKAIQIITKMKDVKKIKIEAQEYLKSFYESFGFKQTSKAYDDNGVVHIDMELEINSPQAQ